MQSSQVVLMLHLSIYIKLKDQMTSFNFATSPQIQFPLRLSHDLTNRLNQISKTTRIPKSTLGRIAIKTLLDEIDEKGITSVLEAVQS